MRGMREYRPQNTYRRAVHVIPRGAKWVVRSAGATRAHKVVGSQSEAIKIGRRIAMKRASELVVHRMDGSIRSKDSFPEEAATS
jgi:hypothetical protein